MTKEEFAKAMSFLGLAYNKEFSQEQVGVWFSFFHETQFNDFKLAMTRLVSKSKYIPSIAEIKHEIALIKNPALQLDANEEWAKVQKAVRSYGFYNAEQAIKSLEPFTQKVVRQLGGFAAVCTSEDGDWLRKNFLRLFGELSEASTAALMLSEPQMTLSEIQRIAEIKQQERNRLLLEGRI